MVPLEARLSVRAWWGSAQGFCSEVTTSEGLTGQYVPAAPQRVRLTSTVFTLLVRFLGHCCMDDTHCGCTSEWWGPSQIFCGIGKTQEIERSGVKTNSTDSWGSMCLLSVEESLSKTPQPNRRACCRLAWLTPPSVCECVHERVNVR